MEKLEKIAEKIASCEMDSNLITIQKGNHKININNKGEMKINSEFGKLHFLNQ